MTQTSPALILYSMSGCPSCERLKARLDEVGASYEVRDLSNDENGNARRQKFYDDHNLEGNDRRVPKLFEIRHDGTEDLIGNEADSMEYLDVTYS